MRVWLSPQLLVDLDEVAMISEAPEYRGVLLRWKGGGIETISNLPMAQVRKAIADRLAEGIAHEGEEWWAR